MNYEAQLEKSVNHDEVVALYAAAGLSLEEDLARLAAAPRIAADPTAVAYLSENISFNGNLSGIPVLAVHSTGDGLVTEQHEFAYRSAALAAQDAQLLKQAFVYRAGHNVFTTAEVIASFQALFERIETGKWGGSASSEGLNAAAEALGPTWNRLWLNPITAIPLPPAFYEHDAASFLRPYNVVESTALAARGPQQRESAGASRGSGIAVRTLSAWPLPYRGGSLQVSFRGANVASNPEVGIYDVSGRRVRLLTGANHTGSGSLQWDGRDARGAAVGSGIYFLRVTGAGQEKPLKVAVLR